MLTPTSFHAPQGSQENYAAERGLRRVISMAACLATVLFGIWLIFSHLPALIISIPVVAANLGDASNVLYVITPVAVPIVVLRGFPLYLYFSGIVTAIMLSLLWVFKNEFKEFAGIVIAVLELGKRFPLESKNSCILIPQLFMAVMSFSVVYFYLIQFFDIRIVSPDFGTFALWHFLFDMANASVYEEIISRVVLIGIPLLIIHIAAGQNETRIYKYFFGGGFEIGKLSVFLIIVSSVIFGTAHVLYGWDWYKFPETFIVGIVLGYLFLKKGLYAPILLHFAIDFTTALPTILHTYKYVGSVPGPLSAFYALAVGANNLSILALVALILLGVFLGPIYFGYYTKNAVKHFISILQK